MFVYNPPTEPYLTVIHGDEDLIVVDKPAELLSVPGRDIAHKDSVMTRAIERYGQAFDVHRLDMATSGIIVVARTKEAERELKRQFRDRETSKQYLARVWGHPEQDEGLIDLPLICDYPNRPKQIVCFEHGKPSQTKYKVIRREAQTTLMALTPITGRSHQLRVHMQALGHPIVGDRFYADGAALEFSDRLELHAYKLRIKQPTSGRWLELKAPCPFA